MKVITDFNAPELDLFARLTEAQLRSRQEAEKGIFIAESAVVIASALDAGYEPIALLTDKKHMEGAGREIISRCGENIVYTAEDDVLERLTGYHMTRGILCAMRRKALQSVDEICAHARRVAVLEDITDSTNVGAVIRSAAALGIDAVLLTPACCDALCRRAVRVSMGTVFKVPWTRIGDSYAAWPQNGMAQLKEMGFHTVALALEKRSVRIDDARLQSAEKLALILGTEGTGLKKETLALCDDTAIIPMTHGVDSLNVAAGAAVAFWQLGNNR